MCDNNILQFVKYVCYLLCYYNNNYIDCLLSGEYQLGWKTRHSTVVINTILYCWGGYQEGLPYLHDNEEKRKFTSSVDLLHLPAFKWERMSTTGIPPAGVMGYACTTIDNKILFFGGSCKTCKHDECCHNNLYEFDSLNKNWREIVNSTPDNVPMKKIRCGMISFKIKEKNYVLVFGGYGPVPVAMHSHSLYIPLPNFQNRCMTNEVHIMCVTTSPGIT